MSSVNYSKWDALSSDDEDGSRVKPTVVRKQATTLTAEEEAKELAQIAQEAHADGAALDDKLGNLERELAELKEASPTLGEVCETPEVTEVTTPKGSTATEATGLSTTPARRRGLDRTWEVVVENEFEATHGPDSLPPDGGRGKAIADELRSAAAAVATSPQLPRREQQFGHGDHELASITVPEVAAAASAGVANGGEKEKLVSTLRRVKQLDEKLAGAIEQECGVKVGKSDVFRLMMPNAASCLKQQTRVLVVMAGEDFLVEEPICEEDDNSPSGLGHGDAEARADEFCTETASPEVGADGECAENASPEKGASGETDSLEAGAGGSSMEIELCFFRGSLRHKSMSRRLGRVPALHVSLVTNDGMRQAMEFIGVHQRQYCVEDPPTDAISRNLQESLLKVVLEFVLHPSRTRYVKEKVVFRECSSDPEVRSRRQVLLPLMMDKVREANPVIKQVDLEFCEARTRTYSRCAKRRSYLVVDEDVLKVAPVRKSMMKSPSASGAFSGFGQGFLNTKKVRQRGIEGPRALEDLKTVQISSSSSSSSSAAPLQGISDGIKPSERTRINPAPAVDATPPPVCTSQDEKRRLLLGSAELRAEIAQAPQAGTTQPSSSSTSDAALPPHDASVEEEAELEDDEDGEQSPGQGGNISDLANRLFGDDFGLEPRDAAMEDSRTESTSTPSPKASSLASRGELAPSERSEPVTEEGADIETHGGVASSTTGFRLLQQRRQERRRVEEAEQVAREASTAEQQSDDLVNLWMKQRW